MLTQSNDIRKLIDANTEVTVHYKENSDKHYRKWFGARNGILDWGFLDWDYRLQGHRFSGFMLTDIDRVEGTNIYLK